MKESIYKNNKQIDSTVTITTWVLSTEWTRTWPSTGLVSEWKNVGGPRLVWMVDIVLQGVWVFYRINKVEGDKSPVLLALGRDIVNAIFLKYSKGGRLSSSHTAIRNIPSDICYDDAKHYQMQFEWKTRQV